MGAHLDELWTMLETAHPDEWQRNRELWRDFAIRFVGSMTPAQRAAGSAWLAKMAETLEAVSRDEPSFVPGDDPTIGCLVETALTGRDGSGRGRGRGSTRRLIAAEPDGLRTVKGPR